ncbi:MAG: methyltransferase type 11 [uncultured bacterium]|nr:MAG: methyltransferase type 11 [uncultured bacterium]
MEAATLKYFEEFDDKTVAHYNKKADEYFVHFANGEFEKNKPFGNHVEAAMISYQMGLLLSGAKIGRAQKIMEIGPGAGWLSSMIHRLGNEVFLLETSDAALTMAKELFAMDARNSVHSMGPHFLTYDGYRFPLEDNSIDRILCFDALHHIPNPGHIFSEMYRVLRSGGVVGFAESGEDHAMRPAIIDCVGKTGILERSTSLSDIQYLAKKAGFSKVTVKAFPLVSDWEITLPDYHQAVKQGKSPVDANKIDEANQVGDQTLFFLYKDHFQFNCKYPNKPLSALHMENTVIQARRGAVTLMDVTVANTGDTTLNHEDHPLGGFAMVGAHLLQEGKLLDYDFFQHALDKSICPGETITQTLQFLAPKQSGVYHLELDIVIKGVKWLQLDGAKTVNVTLIVE